MDSRCRQGDSTFEASPSRVLFQTAPSAVLRLRTDAAKRFEKVENATAVIWKMLLLTERKFRRLNAPELVKEVYLGVRFANGERRKEDTQEAVA
jgi:putative transposase